MTSFSPLANRFRTIFQYVFPVLVAGDTVRSCLVVRQLAIDRLNEWEQEENTEVLKNTTTLLQHVVRSCHAQHPDFWPKNISALAGVSPPTSAQIADAAAVHQEPAAQKQPTVSLLDELLALNAAKQQMTTNATTTKRVEENKPGFNTHAVTSSSSSQHHREQQQSQPQEQQKQQRRHLVIYVTMDDVWSHLTQTLHFLAPTATTTASNIILHAQINLDVQSRMMKAVDELKTKLSKSMPCWPQASIQRKSALRYSVSDWRMQWHEDKHSEKLERVLLDESVPSNEQLTSFTGGAQRLQF